MTDRNQLMQTIRKLDFALYDLKLYLDTHNRCPKGLQLYRNYRNQREAAVQEYTRRFGPIEAIQSHAESEWEWIKGPYPWEREAN